MARIGRSSRIEKQRTKEGGRVNESESGGVRVRVGVESRGECNAGEEGGRKEEGRRKDESGVKE